MCVKGGNILGEYCLFFTPCSWNYLQNNWINLYRNDFVSTLCATIKSFIIRQDHVSRSSSRLTAEIQRFLLSVVVSSNSSPWFLTNDGIRKNGWVFFFSLFLQQPTTMQTTISTSVRAGFDYVWGTPTWRMATVVQRWVTWVKTKNRGFTVTLQYVSIQGSTSFPGY